MIFLTTLVIWTISQNSTQGGWLESQMLDTFDNHIVMQANVPISVAVMTMPNYGKLWLDLDWFQYVVRPAQSLLGNWITLKPPTYNSTVVYNSSTPDNYINFWFNLSSGCGDYVYIIYPQSGNLQSFHLTPDVTAVYNPNTSLTGVCK